jgi:hypothetical protein
MSLPFFAFVAMAAALSPAEKTAFRMWFTFLAEAQFYVEPSARPKEIIDCSSLARYAFREAFARHDADWRRRNPLPLAPSLPEAPFRAGPLFETDSGLRHFADAQTLMRRNTRPLGRDLRRAAPGDLLFYEQLDDPANWHMMIWLGDAQVEGGPGPWVIYHTGPVGKMTGEMRKLRLPELMQHPQPRWRPVEGNRAFRGVYRWKILED